MKQKSLLLSLTALFTSLLIFGQSRFVYYFNENLNSVKKSDAVFTGFGNFENGLVKVEIVFNQTKQPVIIANYKDSTLAEGQGLYQSYFLNGKKESEGNYEKNREDGLWKKWDSTGNLIDSSIYDHGRKMSKVTFEYDKNRRLKSYDFDDLENDKKEKFVYNDSGKVISEILFTGQKGIAKHFTNEGIKIDSLFTRAEIEASFPGGQNAWIAFVTKQIRNNIEDLTRDGKSGTCRVRFVIDVEGNVQEVKAITMQKTVLAQVAVNAIKKGPKWNPAMQYGKPVKAYREQPFTFTIAR